MKYGDYLQKKMNPEWEFFYVNYDLLKTIIKKEKRRKILEYY